MFWKEKINSADSQLEHVNKSAMQEQKVLCRKNNSAMNIIKRQEWNKVSWKLKALWKLKRFENAQVPIFLWKTLHIEQ